MSYRKLQLKLGDYERKILHIGTIKFRPENCSLFPAKITRKRLYLKETAILNFKYIPPKNGRGAAAPLVDWNRRP